VIAFEKVLGQAAIVIPLAHIVSCGLYLAGYSTGFGGQVGNLFLPSDFFTITIQSLVPLYAFGLGLPAFVLLLRQVYLNGVAENVVLTEQDEVKMKKSIAEKANWEKLMNVIVALSTCVYIIHFISEIYIGSNLDILLLITLLTNVFIPFWWRTANKLNLSEWREKIIFICTYFCITVFAIGADNGERDRRAEYSSFLGSRMTCGNHIVLAPVGSKFLSVTPNGQRHIIDESCKPLFDFHQAPPFTSGPAIPLAFQKLRERFQ
jgi:hypothetical protein